ncbi:MAG: methyltransferase, partial [Myxococcota bacterium]|nr:methyltransferase [Myxococcota bacterium]
MTTLTLERRFEALTHLLARYHSLWSPLPFKHKTLPWESNHPELSAWLVALSDAEVDTLETNSEQLAHQLRRFLPPTAALLELCDLPRLSPTNSPQKLKGPTPGVPGRKWAQIESFAATLPEVSGPWIEWCAGKGHLARTISQLKHTPIQCLEWDLSLCTKGQAMATKELLPLTFSPTDVLQNPAIAPGSNLVALHACGDLHRALLHRGTEHRATSISYSPCCYHRTQSPAHSPLSQLGQRLLSFPFSAQDLRLAVHETVTAPTHDRRRRVQNSVWRLAFDELQRELRGVDHYKAQPSFRAGELSLSFPEFCLTLCEQSPVRGAAGRG